MLGESAFLRWERGFCRKLDMLLRMRFVGHTRVFCSVAGNSLSLVGEKRKVNSSCVTALPGAFIHI